MRKELLISAAGLLLAGSGTAYSACTPVLDCATLGYKYSSSECSGSGVACPFDTTKYFCNKSATCNYTITAANCLSQCKTVGSNACAKNGTVYYESCGSSYCSPDQTCSGSVCSSSSSTYGGPCCSRQDFCSGPVTAYQSCKETYNLRDCTPEFGNSDAVCAEGNISCKNLGSVIRFGGGYNNFVVHYISCSGCNYTYTKETCATLCKNVGSKSCTVGGKTYYESCGASLCKSNEKCIFRNYSHSECVTTEGTSGSCCQPNFMYKDDECRQYANNPALGAMPARCRCTGYPSCYELEAKCHSIGGGGYISSSSSAVAGYICHL